MPRSPRLTALFATLGILFGSQAVFAADGIDFSRAIVINLGEPEGSARQAVPLLVEEIAKRTHASWQAVQEMVLTTSSKPIVVIGRWDAIRAESDRLKLGLIFPEIKSNKPRTDGYRIGVKPGDRPIIWVAGDDDRGVLYGAGRLLRALKIERNRVQLPADFREDTAPQTALRGIQLGYRPKTNSYDAWTLAMWEQYYRDLIIFGCNAIELIPPRSDDDDDSPHYPVPPLEMMTAMSKLADKYGLEVWIWYPAMDENYANPATVEFAIKEWNTVFQALPRIDAIFVPGGDPGHTHPRALMALLEKQTASLKKRHPKATMWVSPQSFSQAWLDEFVTILQDERTSQWLTGVVHGPQNRWDLPEFRKAIPARYPVRDYPDITHSRHSQYPVPDWDLAFALTEGRETINPRPQDMGRIYRRSRPHTSGFIVYSEGCNDDVNKFIWLGLGWNEQAQEQEILRQYSQWFINTELGDRFSEGLFALEKNWQGPILDNAGITKTLQAFQTLETEADPGAKANWRFQQALYRAYYDAAIQVRLKRELQINQLARTQLGEGKISEALETLNAQPLVTPWEARVRELAEALFQSIRMQLSVKKYQAIAIERGANLDGLHAPLTDNEWLKDQVVSITTLKNQTDRDQKIRQLLDRANPGPGGFYDDLGNPQKQPHLVRGVGPADDPAYYRSSLLSTTIRNSLLNPSSKAMPRAWWDHAEPLFDAPLQLHYPQLDMNASYRVRVVYVREIRPTKIRLVANKDVVIHDYLDQPFKALEFSIPKPATAKGTLTLSWTKEPGLGGAGRGCQVAEVWLLKE